MGWNPVEAVGNAVSNPVGAAVDFAEGSGQVATGGAYQGGNPFNVNNYGMPSVGGTYEGLNKTFFGTLPNLNSQKGSLPTQTQLGIDPRLAELSAQREKTLKSLQDQENQLKGAMLTQTGETGKAIDKQLSELINQTGYFTGLANQTTGASMASRNMTRSGIAGAAIGSNMLRGEAQKGQIKQTAETQKRQVAQNILDTQRDVQQKRMDISNRLQDLEIQGLGSIEYQKAATQMQDDFKAYVANLNLSTQQKNDMYALMGSLGTVAGLGAGYYATKDSSTAKTTTPSA